MHIHRQKKKCMCIDHSHRHKKKTPTRLCRTYTDTKKRHQPILHRHNVLHRCTYTDTQKKDTNSYTYMRIRTAGLILYGHEGCPETRLVREALSSLQLPFALVPCATAGGSRPHPGSHGGVGGVERIPALVDGERMLCGGREAAEYLREKYARGPPLSYFVRASREEAL